MDPIEHKGSDYWLIWYKLPHTMASPHGKVERVILLISKVGAKLHHAGATEGECVLAAEVSLEHCGATLHDLGFLPVSEENAERMATSLVAWAKLRFGEGTQVEDKMALIDIATDVFVASGLGGTVYPNDGESLADVSYCLKAEGKPDVMLGISMNKNRAHQVLKANAWESDTGAALHQLDALPATEENMRSLALKLVEWARTR